MADTLEPWDPRHLYVVGHLRPDTDAIASAMGYAWYLRAIGQSDAIAARTGLPSTQTRFALRRFGIEAPPLLTDVAPTFRHTLKEVACVRPENPLSDAVVQLGYGGARVVPVVSAEGVPRGVVTPRVLARACSDTAGLAAAMIRPCADFTEDAPVYPAADRISSHRRALLRNEQDDFLIVDSDGLYRGVATRAGVLDPPRARLVLVDHNELDQSVSGADEAEITAVLDHHRLGNPSTATPIPFVVEPVGSTSTLVAERCKIAKARLPAELAGILVSGILADTLVFRSPTATDRDRLMADWLGERASLDVDAWGAELLASGPGLTGRLPHDVLESDRKRYTMGRFAVSLAQVEVASFRDLAEVRGGLLSALEEVRLREGLSLACLMVTDVLVGRSILLATGERSALTALPFPRHGEGGWDLDEIVSRKKELVPALEDAFAD